MVFVLLQRMKETEMGSNDEVMEALKKEVVDLVLTCDYKYSVVFVEFFFIGKIVCA